eukprot:2396121-Rhodomonas_salina.1
MELRRAYQQEFLRTASTAGDGHASKFSGSSGQSRGGQAVTSSTTSTATTSTTRGVQQFFGFATVRNTSEPAIKFWVQNI